MKNYSQPIILFFPPAATLLLLFLTTADYGDGRGVSVRINLTVDTAVCYNFPKTYIMSSMNEQDSN